ncbi:hypothetical protein JCM15519_36500 [Fundidesulfovibrio butyratiphilus]
MERSRPLAASRVAWSAAAGAFALTAALPSGVALVDASPRGWILAACAPLLAALFVAVARARAHMLACFGAALPFFGYQSYSMPSQAASFLVAWLVLACLAVNARQARQAGNGPARLLFAGFVAVLAAGVAFLPWSEFVRDLRVVGPVGFARMFAFSVADSPYYALSSLVRLPLFALLAWELSKQESDRTFKPLFDGVAAGLAAAVAFGLAEYFLARGKAFALNDRLSSLFLNPGWFAEYVCMAFPFLYGLGRGRMLAKMGLCLAGAACLVAMVLSMARAAWVVFACLGVASAVFWAARFDLFAVGRGRLVRGAAWGAGAVLVLTLGLYGVLAVSKVSLLNFPLATMIAQRVERFTESPRPQVFKSGLLIGAESPTFGLGYETYAWRYRRLMADPGSLLARGMDPKAEVFEATHNYFIQIFAGGGLVALALWLALAWRAYALEAACHRRRADALSLGVLVALTAFHAFGLFQEMTYVPTVWLLTFLLLAHALGLEDTLGGWASPKRAVWGVRGVAAVVLAALVWNLVAAHRLDARPGRAAELAGFSAPEVLEGLPARWSLGASRFTPRGQGPWVFTVGCPHPDMGKRPVTVELLDQDGPLASVRFDAHSGHVARLVVDADRARPGRPVWVRVSRLFCPAAAGIKDPRCLGAWIAGPGLP